MNSTFAIALGRTTLLALLSALPFACSKDEPPREDRADAGRFTLAERPDGPSADVSEEISGGGGPFIGAAAGLAAQGYVEQEFVAAGTATSYEPSSALRADGRWDFEPSSSADYRTRIIVRRPEHSSDFSGVVIVEWLNVSGGVDANPEYASLEEEITRRGHTWVGVSAQMIGIEGGPVLVTTSAGAGVVGKGLKAIDPVRYGSLAHPGDGYAFDIFTQVTRALLEGGAVLGGAKPRIAIAAGESQSAFALTTYYDGVQPLTRAFDGFLVHSRGASSLPLVGPGKPADLAGAIANPTHPVFRDDLDAPVLELQAESDVNGILNSSAARQPDSDRFRLWEVTGTAHADAHLLGPAANSLDCGVPVNNGPMHLVAKAALRSLETWVESGKRPPTAARLELTDDFLVQVRRNTDGIALGGVRTPPVDTPVDVLSGAPGPKLDLICLLLGSTTPLSEARLSELYPDRAAYEQRYGSAADAAIKAGFVLDDDRAALLDFAQPSRIAP